MQASLIRAKLWISVPSSLILCKQNTDLHCLRYLQYASATIIRGCFRLNRPGNQTSWGLISHPELSVRWTRVGAKTETILEDPRNAKAEYIEDTTRWREDINFMFSWQEQYLTRSLRSLVRYYSCNSNIKFISSRHRVIFSIYYPTALYEEYK